MQSAAGQAAARPVAINPIGASNLVLLKRAPLEGPGELRPAEGKSEVRVGARAPEEEREELSLSSLRLCLPKGFVTLSCTDRLLGLRAAPDRLKVGSREAEKPSWEKDRLTS